MEEKNKKEVPLATEIIRTMKKVIFALLIVIVFIVGGFIWYLSLPVEYVDTNNYNNINQNTDTSGNNVIGDDVIGDTDNR